MSIEAQKDPASQAPYERRRRRWWRKAYVLPAEHGSWSWLLVPYLVGAAVAPRWTLASVLVLLGGLGVFLLRQPASAWLRIRRGRGRRADAPVALAWVWFFALLALLSLTGLLLLGVTDLLWLLPPVTALFVVYIAVSQINRAGVRSMWMEVAGAAGLAVMAPAAFAAGSGVMDALGWLLWLFMALQNTLGALYVRLRIADSHNRPEPRLPVLLVHGLAVSLIAAATKLAEIPWLVVAPYLFFLFRAGWLALDRRPIAHIKRFGFAEVGVELLAGLWLVLVFHFA